MKYWYIFFIFSLLACNNQVPSSVSIQEGDLIFQDLDCGPLCDAIEKVTEGVNGYDFSHVGWVLSQNDSLYILEAISAGVVLTPLDTFLARTPKYIVSRFKELDDSVFATAKMYGLSKLGTPYDDPFLPNNGKYYCSELLAEAFAKASEGEIQIEQPPMTFKDPETGAFFPAWVSYYEALEMEIPEGIAGCNPGGFSKDARLDVVFVSDQLRK